MSLPGAGTPSMRQRSRGQTSLCSGKFPPAVPLGFTVCPLRALAHEAPRHLSPGDPCTWSYSKTPTGMEPAAQHPMGPSVVRWWDQRAGPLWGKVHGLEGCPVYPARAWQAAGGGESNKIHVRV